MGGCGSQEGKVLKPKYKPPKGGYTSADQLEDYKYLFRGKTSSALSRALNQDIWDEYKDKTDAHGVSFKTCIFSGVKNLDSGIGLYAGSEDSYHCFNKLFDKVILEYHGHKPEDKHVADMDAEKIVNAEFTEEDAAMIKSTRIRVGRNLAGAVLDVMSEEPLPAEHPLWLHPGVQLTPHISGYHLGDAVLDIAENYRRLQANEPLLHLIDRVRGY